MSFDAHKNFAYSTVATAPSPASSGTSLVVASGDGTKFPAVSFNATVWPAGAQPTTANAEIVRVTAISTDTFTITRTQESTSARTIVIGDQIAATITAKTLTDVETTSPSAELDYVEVTSTVTASGTSGAQTTVIDGNAVTYDGSTKVKIEFWCGQVDSVNGNCIIEFWDGSTDIGKAAQFNQGGAASLGAVKCERFYTPSAGSHTFHVKAWKTAGTGYALLAGAGGVTTSLPMWYRITRA